MALTAIGVWAGTVDSPGTPGSTYSNTMEDIYDRLTTGYFHQKSNFQEPKSGPASGTMRTLDEIYSVAKPGAITQFVPTTGDTYDDPCCTGEDGETRYGRADWELVPTGGWSGALTISAWTGVRFTDNGDGTVTDNLTGLIWVKDFGCLVSTYKGNWPYALSVVKNLHGNNGLCGVNDGSVAGDWRIPNIHELHSLIDINQNNPALPTGHPFTNVPGGMNFTFIWSSTTFQGDETYALVVFLGDGSVLEAGSKVTEYNILFVRGGI